MSRETPPPAGPCRVLFLDDEGDIVEAFVVAAGMSGIEARGYTDPLGALECFRRESAAFRAVITDFTMPQMECARFIAHLREIRPDIPVHLCTGNAEHDIRPIAQRLGVRSILYKPFGFEALEEFLSAIAGAAG